jgi:Skp family chaperone for outer membrane proteins
MSLRIVIASLVMMCGSVPAFAQGANPPPAAPAPATQPAPVPLPAGARIAYVNLQVVFSESAEGKKGQERWKVLSDKLFAGLSARGKEIQGLSEKIQTQNTLVDPGVLQQWNQDLARLQREAQFAEQEAQVQRDQLQQQVLADFEKLVVPVIHAMRIEKKLDAIFAVQGEASGLTLISIEPGLDLSAELVKRLNSSRLNAKQP